MRVPFMNEDWFARPGVRGYDLCVERRQVPLQISIVQTHEFRREVVRTVDVRGHDETGVKRVVLVESGADRVVWTSRALDRVCGLFQERDFDEVSDFRQVEECYDIIVGEFGN